jgi:hypothetical protein
LANVVVVCGGSVGRIAYKSWTDSPYGFFRAFSHYVFFFRRDWMSMRCDSNASSLFVEPSRV